MKFLVHAMRRDKMENKVLTGMEEGKRARGRQRNTGISMA